MRVIETDVILAAALGYSDSALHNFLASLRTIGFTKKIVFFVDKGRPPVPRYDLDLTLIEIDRRDRRRSPEPSTRRYTWIADFLRAHRCAGRIMLSDVRDIVFQSDPFQSPDVLQCDLLFALEEKSIGACGWNSNWICKMYGAAILDSISGHIISCSGTTIGRYDNIVAYVAKMCRHLEMAPDIFGPDQGVHNYILYRDVVTGQRLGLNGLGYVATLQYMHKVAIVGGAVVNYDGTRPAVVHQYDRLSVERQRDIAAVSVPIG